MDCAGWVDLDLSGYAPLCSPTPLPGGATYTILATPGMLEEEPRTLHELQVIQGDIIDVICEQGEVGGELIMTIATACRLRCRRGSRACPRASSPR